MTIDRNDLAEELLLRENIRKTIKIIKNKRREDKKLALLEEKTFRHIVRRLLKEDVSAVSDSPSQSTAINILEELLKKIIPVLEEDFKSLTTNKEQRDSFRAHIVNAIERALTPAEVNANVPTSQADGALQELLDTLKEVDVTIGGDDDDMPEEFIDISGEEEEVEEVPASEEEEFAKGLEDREFNLVGRNMGLKSFKKIEQNILNSFAVVEPDEEDREIFYDYLITNVKLYFDRFEKEIEPSCTEEPTTPEYDEAALDQEPTADQEEEEAFALEEYIDLDGLLEGYIQIKRKYIKEKVFQAIMALMKAYTHLGTTIGRLVEEKDQAYGSSFQRAPRNIKNPLSSWSSA
jgi:hypothetical protein